MKSKIKPLQGLLKNMQKIKNLSSIMVLLICSITLFGQSEHDHYLQTAVIRLLEGKCERAGANYNVYKEMTGKTDLELEGMMKSCKEGVPTRITAKVDSVWWENGKQGEERGMKIHVKFETDNMLHVNGMVCAYFHLSDGTALNDINEHYRTGNKTVATGKSFKPPYKGSAYKDFDLFIPYDEFHLPSGKHDLKFRVAIVEFSTEEGIFMAWSEYIHITYSK